MILRARRKGELLKCEEEGVGRARLRRQDSAGVGKGVGRKARGFPEAKGDGTRSEELRGVKRGHAVGQGRW